MIVLCCKQLDGVFSNRLFGTYLVFAGDPTLAVADFDDFVKRSSNVMWCAVSVDARLNVNVALNRPSYQDSTADGRTADRANDGNHNTDTNAGSCMETLGSHPEPNPWWVVDLGMKLRVHSVKLTNRNAGGTAVQMTYFSELKWC